MANKPYRPLYIGDHDRECKSLSLEAEGALVRIKNTLWDSKTPGLLSFCFSNLCVLLKNPPEKVHKIISELNDFTTVFIKILPENRVEICCQEMIEKAELSAIRAESGSKGGRPKKQSESKTKPKEKQTQTKTVKYESDIETEDENKIELGRVGGKAELMPTFEQFWNEYDKKVDRPKCELKWKNLKQAEKEKIMAYLPRYKLATQDKKFRRDPATFLNNKTWENELTEQNGTNGKFTGSNLTLSPEYRADLERRIRS